MIVVKSYDKLKDYVQMWVDGYTDLLIIEGSAGMGKTSMVKEVLYENRDKARAICINSHITPVMAYKTLYENRDKLIWYDDIYQLLINQLNVSILKQLCETREVKKVSYYSTSKQLEKEQVPLEFNTTSRVLITCNAVSGNNPHVMAVKDRGFHIVFKPTRNELINHLQTVSIGYDLLDDKGKEEVLKVIEYNSKFIKNLSLRTLIKGFQLYKHAKLTNRDWLPDFLDLLGIDEKLKVVTELLNKYNTDKDRLKEWEWSERSYYRYKAIIGQTNQPFCQTVN